MKMYLISHGMKKKKEQRHQQQEKCTKRSEDKISESKIDKTTDKEKEFFWQKNREFSQKML